MTGGLGHTPDNPKTQKTDESGAITSNADLLNLVIYDSGVTVHRGIREVKVTVLQDERTEFDPRLKERYEALKREHDEAIAAGQKLEFKNGMQSSVVSHEIKDGILHLTVAPTPYLYVVAFKKLIEEGQIALSEREAVSPNMLGTGLYAQLFNRGTFYTWCQVKGQKDGVDVMGAGEVHSAFIGGSVSGQDLQTSDPLKSARYREGLEEQGFTIKDENLSKNSMIVHEIGTGNFNVYRTVELTVAQVKESYLKRVAKHIESGAVGKPEVAAVVLVSNETPIIGADDGIYKIQPFRIINIENGEAVVHHPGADDFMPARPHAAGFFACTQRDQLESIASHDEPYVPTPDEESLFRRMPTRDQVSAMRYRMK